MSVGIFIQARISSKRLPGKALLPLGDKTILEQLCLRCITTSIPTYVLTSHNGEDDSIALKLSNINGLSGIYRGSLEDVRERFINAAETFGVRYIIRVTADNPFTETGLIKRLAEYGVSNDLDYLRGSDNHYLEGTNSEFIALDALLRSRRLFKSQSDKEHVTPSLRKETTTSKKELCEQMTILTKKVWKSSITVDTREDYVAALRVHDELVKACGNWLAWEYTDLLRLLESDLVQLPQRKYE